MNGLKPPKNSPNSSDIFAIHLLRRLLSRLAIAFAIFFTATAIVIRCPGQPKLPEPRKRAVHSPKWSEVVKATILSPQFSALAIPPQTTSLRLEILPPPPPGEFGYRIYYRKQGDDPYVQIPMGTNRNALILDLTIGATYEFKATAYYWPTGHTESEPAVIFHTIVGDMIHIITLSAPSPDSLVWIPILTNSIPKTNSQRYYIQMQIEE
jgi:hypothetical protein